MQTGATGACEVAHAVLDAPAKGRAGPPPGAHGTRGARSYGGGESADSIEIRPVLLFLLETPCGVGRTLRYCNAETTGHRKHWQARCDPCHIKNEFNIFDLNEIGIRY